MKREIKFRSKRLDNGEWVYGNLIIAENGAPYILPPDICEVDGHHLLQGDDVPHRVDPATVGQFTGLKDQNGLEIYEDDIMEIPETEFNARIIGTVEYQEDSFIIQSRNGGSAWGLHWSLRKHDAGILGNIYDHPNLLNH